MENCNKNEVLESFGHSSKKNATGKNKTNIIALVHVLPPTLMTSFQMR